MEGFIGQPVQQAMLKYGPPTNAFDMGDGKRAFQWVVTKQFTTPTNVSSYGHASGYGNHVSWTENSTITGGVPIINRCVYTMYGEWKEHLGSWVLVGFEKPKLSCE